MEKYGEAIRAARKAKKLKGKELAKIVGISPELYAQIEKGYRNPSPKVVLLLAKTLDNTHLFLFVEEILLAKKAELSYSLKETENSLKQLKANQKFLNSSDYWSRLLSHYLAHHVLKPKQRAAHPLSNEFVEHFIAQSKYLPGTGPNAGPPPATLRKSPKPLFKPASKANLAARPKDVNVDSLPGPKQP